MLTLWDPFFSLKNQADSRISAKSYFDRLFEDNFESSIKEFFSIDNYYGINSKINEDKSISIYIDVPGVKESDINIEVVDNLLSVKGERKTDKSSYQIQKSLRIPKGYDTNNIIAELEHGVLHIKMPAKEESNKEIKKIPILAK